MWHTHSSLVVRSWQASPLSSPGAAQKARPSPGVSPSLGETRSHLVLWLLQDFELLRSHRHVLRTEHCPAQLHRRNLWCDETDKMDCFSLIRNDSEPLRFSENLKTPMEIHWKDWCWCWNANTLATWYKELTHLKRPWCWERLKAGGEGDDRRWDGWMPSLTQWTWVWVSSGSWWWTGRPGMLQSMGSQRVRHDWVTELNWTDWWRFRYAQESGIKLLSPVSPALAGRFFTPAPPVKPSETIARF